MRKRGFANASAKSTFGVVMDIDGVLYRGTEVLPGAVETIELLRENRYGCLSSLLPALAHIAVGSLIFL